MKTLSVVIPAYNEETFIRTLLEQVLAVPTEEHGYGKEIMVVDDGSSDRTAEIASEFRDVRVIKQVPNQGKGAAVRRGIQESTGEYLLVQDADLEYDPQDYIPMLHELAGRSDVAVYGSRPLGSIRERGWLHLFPGKHRDQGVGPWAMNWLLSLLTLALFGCVLTDMLTAYKLYPTKVIKSFTIRTCGFETDHELSSKLVRAGIRIVEVPISYAPRSAAEGKKIRAVDGLIAIWTLLKFRFVD